MRFKTGDIVAIKPDGYWNMQCWHSQSLEVPIGIVVSSYETEIPSYTVEVGLEKKWVYESDLDF